MEIIHVVLGKANPDRMNGVNKVVNELAAQQSAAGHHVTIWGISGDTKHNYPSRQYHTVLFKRHRNPFRLPSEMTTALAKTDEHVVFHLHGGFLPQMYQLSALLHEKKRSFVFTPHGSYNLVALRKNYLTKKLYYTLFEKQMLERAAAIHILGKSEGSLLAQTSLSAKVTTIPYGFSVGGAMVGNNRSDKPFTIGYCGRIDIHTKGLDALVEGYARFSAEVPDSRMLIIGDGKELPKLKQAALKRGLSDRILFTGQKFGKEKTELLGTCDVFAHPSRNEGLPSAILEAAAMGLPSLVTAATNLGTYVSNYDAGLQIAYTDGDLVYRGLRVLYSRLSNEKSYNFMRQQAQTMVREAFDWNLLLESYDEMYQKALQCRQG